MSESFDPGAAFEKLRPRLQAADLRPVRPFVPSRRVALVVGTFAAVSALLLWWVVGWRPDVEVLGFAWAWGVSAVELGAALALLAWVLREATPGRSVSAAGLAAAAAGAAALHAAVIAGTFARSPVFPAAGHPWQAGLLCFAFEVGLAVPCVLFALWLGRRGLTSRPRRLGLAGGVGAGLAADAVWRLICPYTAPAHAFGAHTSGVLGAVVLGLLLAWGWELSRARSWRRRRGLHPSEAASGRTPS